MRILLAARAWLLSLAVAVTGLSGVTRAEDAPEIPLAVVSVASLERLMKGADVAFESAGRPELSETLNTALGRVNDLKGLEREQPMGILVYLSGIIPQPVGFVPVKDLDELLKTMEIGPLSPKKTGPDRFEVGRPNGTIYGKIEGKFAFLAPERESLSRKFGDPTKYTGRISSAYDIGVSVNLSSLDKDTKDLFLTYIRSATETDLQQRDNEPDAAYRIRRAVGMSNLDLTMQILREAQELTIGWSVDGQAKNVNLELVLVATPGSDLAGLCNQLGGTRSKFANLLAVRTPMTAAFTWKLSKAGKKMLKEVLITAEGEVLKNLSSDAGAENPVTTLFSALKSTAATGNADAFSQFVKQPNGNFVLLAGMRIDDSEAVAEAIKELGPRLQNSPDLEEVVLDAASHEGVAIHKARGKNSRPEDERLYGSKPSVYFGAGAGVMWFAIGGDEAIPALKKAMDEVAKPVGDQVSTLPLQIVFNMGEWADQFDRNNGGGLAGRARSAFAKGGDVLRIEARPMQDGLRIRFQLDEAFIRLFGGEVARRIDNQSN